MIITENFLDNWVKGHAKEAQGIIVELVYRLVCASSPRPKTRRFPLGDSIGQHGEDGVLDTDYSYLPFIPEGKSVWEIGTSGKAGAKATSDYSDLTKTIPKEVRVETVFIFVTPLSGLSDWESTWKEDAQRDWILKRQNRKEWKDVQVIDGTKLVDWLKQFPAIEIWLAEKMGLSISNIENSELRWENLKKMGEPPSLIPELFCTGRESTCEKLNEVFSNTRTVLQIDSRYHDQIADFVCAHVATIPSNEKLEIEGKCLIVSNAESWKVASSLSTSHYLVADFDISDKEGMQLIEKAKRNKHSVIHRGSIGGSPHANRIAMPNPTFYQVKDNLVKAGYNEERARTLAQKSAGNLNALLRCIQNLSIAPEWALNTDAANLAIAQLLGSWTDQHEDRIIVEELVGKSYGEWIGTIHNIVSMPNTPLINQEEKWKFIGRFEGWIFLANKLQYAQLELFNTIALKVLKEIDTKYDLPKESRWYSIKDTLSHSSLLRKGIAESLALIASLPSANNSIPSQKIERLITSSINEILSSDDWKLWATLKHLLPLLAEASPDAFLNKVESHLKTSTLFESLYTEESSGITGENLMTGMLWALENLAWNPQYTARVSLILTVLAKKDPGGNSLNRPIQSLVAIYLPWYTQTCATFNQKKIIVKKIVEVDLEIAWQLLTALLPSRHGTTIGSSKPIWREYIPENWSPSISNEEYWQQINFYSDEIFLIIQKDPKFLLELIESFDKLTQESLNKILNFIKTVVVKFDESVRSEYWNELSELILNHRKFQNTDWALPSDVISSIESATNAIAPKSSYEKHKVLFTDKELFLYEKKSDYASESKRIEKLRERALTEVLSQVGIDNTLKLIDEVDSPLKLGTTLGTLATKEIEEKLLPKYLSKSDEKNAKFIGHFIWSLNRVKNNQFIYEIKDKNWTDYEKAIFLTYLPFEKKVWDAAAELKIEEIYWKKVNANPYAAEEEMHFVIDKLIYYNRYDAAIDCIGGLLHLKKEFNFDQALKALKGLNSQENLVRLDSHTIVEIINEMQKDESKTDELIIIEWLYISLLRDMSNGRPLTLQQFAADNAVFVHQLIYSVYKSDNKDFDSSGLTKLDPTNAYKVLNNLKIVPGMKKNSNFEATFFKKWVDELYRLTNETGHFEIAQQILGQMLMHSPSDEDLWINKSIAKFLDLSESKVVRHGFYLEYFNSRGVHWVDPEGKAEMELSESYKSKAIALEDFGFFNLSSTLYELSKTYLNEAEERKRKKLSEF